MWADPANGGRWQGVRLPPLAPLGGLRPTNQCQTQYWQDPLAPTLFGDSGQERQPAPRLALPVLRNTPVELPAVRWRHWIVGVDCRGRITLPTDARLMLDEPMGLRAVSRELALLLRSDSVVGAEVRLDGRGRLMLPAWLRRLTDSSRAVLVAARWPDVSLVVISPVSALDALADTAAGEAC